MLQAMAARVPRLARVARFLFSGGTGLALNLALLYALTELLGIWYLLSAVLAFVLSYSASFLLQKFITFRDTDRSRMHLQYGAYLILAAANLVVNTALLYLFVQYLGIEYLLAQALASAVIAVESYFVYQRLIFVPEPLA